jgi:hypothetical protein
VSAFSSQLPESVQLLGFWIGLSLCVLGLCGLVFPYVLYNSTHRFMSLQEAATVLYESAWKSDHVWSYAADRPGAHGLILDSPSDQALNWFARLIVDKNVKIYGKHPPSRIREEIQKTNGFFRNGATEFWLKSLPRPTAPAYVELKVRRSDLRPLIQEASAGSPELNHRP